MRVFLLTAILLSAAFVYGQDSLKHTQKQKPDKRLTNKELRETLEYIKEQRRELDSIREELRITETHKNEMREQLELFELMVSYYQKNCRLDSVALEEIIKRQRKLQKQGREKEGVNSL